MDRSNAVLTGGHGTVGECARPSGDDAGVTVIGVVLSDDFDVRCVAAHLDRGVAHDAHSQSIIRFADVGHDLVGIEPGVALDEQSIADTRRHAFEHRRTVIARDPSRSDTEFRGDLRELVDKSTVASIPSQEQRA